MKASDAEAQLLATLYKARLSDAGSDRDALEQAGECYGYFKEDWSDAFDTLISTGLVKESNHLYFLTKSGLPVARRYYNERPDLYWYYYRQFYPAAYASRTHSRFCQQVFGKDLCQEGQTNMDSLHDLLERLAIDERDTVLDLGCGAGVISEYISDVTGARVTGVDCAAPAVSAAKLRTADKQSRLTFFEGEFTTLSLEPETYDVVISIDTFYIDELFEETVSMLTGALKPGGRLGIFLNHEIKETDSSAMLAVEHSRLWRALSDSNLAVETANYNKELTEFWHRLHSATHEMRDDFAEEGNAFIAENYLRESEQEYLPALEAGTVARYLYIARKP